MRRPLLLGAMGVTACAALIGWRIGAPVPETFSDPKARPPEAAPLCPWREPELDLQRFFPGATRYETQTRILSGLRLELAQRLGRTPTGDENALHLYEVYHDGTRLGTILTRRVKGEYGGIEIVLALDTNRRVRGVRLQRLREPGSIAAAVQNTNWLAGFVDKRAEDPWRLGGDVPTVPSEAQISAAAIVDGARSLLISLATAEAAQAPRLAATHHG
jgi:hypothetical protein